MNPEASKRFVEVYNNNMRWSYALVETAFVLTGMLCLNFLDEISLLRVRTLNIQDCLEKSLKVKFALISTWKTIEGLEKSLLLKVLVLENVQTMVHLFGAAIMLHQLKAPQFYTD